MRLTKIKLAGFKSFVDPTSVGFPTNLVGVVGPNGCGKSNIIDAVRWVMGEISAKHLRGDSMADVIFNGSGTRKPIGTASVELVFDNSDGKLSGEYANYTEVSLKRVVTRDGQSSYFLNGVRCRRKDITQLFLGTGLGSRSYAIIEQNMISRVIEAKAEDMRAFLEEAAGISRYKEKRKETESRIAQTRENLARLGDLRDEVEKQLRHLQRQAATARRYQALKQEERQTHAELLALRMREVESESTARQSILNERDLALQAAVAEQRSIEAAIERARQEHDAQAAVLSEVQGRYYQVGAEISRGEQAIDHAREIRSRQRQELEQIAQGIQDADLHRVRDRQLAAELDAALAEMGPGLEKAREAEQLAAAGLAEAEAAMASWQEQWEGFNQSLRQASSAAGAERARLEVMENQLRGLVGQRDRATQEHGTLSGTDVDATLASLDGQVSQAREQHEATRRQMEELVATLQAERGRERELAQAAQAARRETQEIEGRIVSLAALQRAALGQGQGKVVDWLRARGLDGSPRLAQQLSVDKGWDRAVETVLGSYLEAVCVDSLEDVAATLQSLTAGTVTFFAGAQGPVASGHGDETLRARVRGPAGLDALFEGIVATETLGEALNLRPRLRPGQSVITRDGIWIGPDWLRVSRDKDAHEGVLEREERLRTERTALEAQQARHRAAEHDLEALRARVRELEDRLADQQTQVSRSGAAHMNLRSQIDSLRARAEQRDRRMQQLALELTEVENALEVANAGNRAARGRLEEAVAAMAELEDRRVVLEAERDELRARLTQARERAQVERNAASEAAIRVESRRTSHQSLLSGLERLDSQIGQFETRRQDLESQLASGEQAESQLKATLEEALQRRLAVEAELADARKKMESVDVNLRQFDERRMGCEAAVDQARSALENVRFTVQELRIRREQLVEQFAQTRLELADVVAALAEDANVQAWEQRLAETSEKIERLGAVNLAAIDEFAEQTERKEYLDRQFADLNDALATLEDAIRRIDRETRSRFQDTFDRVNTGLREKFPRLFGGGQAYLELVGDDMLEAGVAIMARPPGKRNSSISMLSGGEKALTAVALVFSIFELNPAPFCLLDEVDAPLDENNVGRFCDIVREMSGRVQFIFVTHNKTTMELANQLLGVTMNEPGCSRLVAVDVDEAVRMAAM
ncbi:MAG TPA: chromosome segregation protein SMC [Steroidobacteraceae bacterium]|nr:chromosome segregation protein SMC [Steroidobacteraceae bacterium]